MINDDNKKSIKKMLKSNALYFALGLCFLSAGAIGISVAGNKTPTATPDENINITRQNIASEENTANKSNKGNGVVIDIEEFTAQKIEEPSTAAVFENESPTVQVNEPEEKKPVVFSSPLSFSMGKDFSMGVPVFSETMKDYRTHNGVDFNGLKGESVKTIAEGTVVSVKKDAVWGNTVTVDHGDGIMSSISGLADEALVSTGAYLYSDTVIGVVGAVPVESSDEPHVHLEVRVNGELVDPLEILGLSESYSE